MFSEDFPENGYRDLIEMDTFIKYFMVQIITNNSDLMFVHFIQKQTPVVPIFTKTRELKYARDLFGILIVPLAIIQYWMQKHFLIPIIPFSTGFLKIRYFSRGGKKSGINIMMIFYQ